MAEECGDTAAVEQILVAYGNARDVIRAVLFDSVNNIVDLTLERIRIVIYPDGEETVMSTLVCLIASNTSCDVSQSEPYSRMREVSWDSSWISSVTFDWVAPQEGYCAWKGV